MRVQVSRNPFAREDVIRDTVETSQGCANCGQKRHRNGKPLGKLFAYGVDPDSVRDRSYIDYSHLFCGVQCFRQYHG